MKTVAKIIGKGTLKVERNDTAGTQSKCGCERGGLKNAVSSAGIIAKTTDGTIKFNFKQLCKH